MLNPFAPHITEEIYQNMGFGGMLNQQKWVTYDEAECVDETVEIVVQINGKVRTKLTIPVNAEQDEVLAQAKANDRIKEALEGKNIIKNIYVKGKLVNFVVR